MRRYLMNSAVCTSPGVYRWHLVAASDWAEPVRAGFDAGELISAIGYPETAEVISRLVGRPISVSRVRVDLEPGDIVYVARLVTRVRAEAKGRRLGLDPEDFEFGILEYQQE